MRGSIPIADPGAGSDLSPQGVTNIADTLRPLLADVFALYVKTKSFHWHIDGPHFVAYHALLGRQATEIFAMTDAIAERARKIGATTIRSIGDIARHQCIEDNNSAQMPARGMLAELCADNQQLTRSLRATHEICERHRDVATAGLIEQWIDQAEGRTWFLSQLLQT